MKTYRVIAALLALVMLLGMFSGCSKNGSETTDPANPSNNPGTKTETNDEKAASTSKYAYQAEYLPIPDNVQYVNTSTISGSSLYFTGSIIDGKQTFTDENGEEMEEFVPPDEALMEKLIQVVRTRFDEDGEDGEEDGEE